MFGRIGAHLVALFLSTILISGCLLGKKNDAQRFKLYEAEVDLIPEINLAASTIFQLEAVKKLRRSRIAIKMDSETGEAWMFRMVQSGDPNEHFIWVKVQDGKLLESSFIPDEK